MVGGMTGHGLVAPKGWHPSDVGTEQIQQPQRSGPLATDRKSRL